MTKNNVFEQTTQLHVLRKQNNKSLV